MSQFSLDIAGPQSLRQTGRSPTQHAVTPVLGAAPILARVDAGTMVPARVVILTALAEEFLAVKQHVTGREEIRHPDGTIYDYGRFTRGDVIWDVAIVETGQGNQDAGEETQRAITYFKPDVVLFVGVAGGRKDVAIGDVVAADKVYNYESGRDEVTFKSRPDAERASYPLEQRARAIVRDWLRQKQAAADADFPRAFVGAIAAGERVVASTESETAKLLNQAYGNALAVEKEGYGFLRTARKVQGGVPALVIRGISDLLDGKEAADQRGSQKLAARHASAFAFDLLAKLNGASDSGQPTPPPVADLPAVSPLAAAAKLRGENFDIGLDQKAPSHMAILRFQQDPESYSLRAHHGKIDTLEARASQLTLPQALGQFVPCADWGMETIGDWDDYQPHTCLIGRALQWLRYLQRQEPMLRCLMIEEPPDSRVPWELLNLGQEALGVALQTVRSRWMPDDDGETQAIPSTAPCCQGQALVYTSGAIAQIGSDFPGMQRYTYAPVAHDQPEQALAHLQQVEITVGLVVMAHLALPQVKRNQRAFYLSRTRLLQQAASVVMLHLAMGEEDGRGQREVAGAFLQHGAKGVLGMLENVDGAIAQQIMHHFFAEYGRDPDLPLPEILRRLRQAIAERLVQQPTGL